MAFFVGHQIIEDGCRRNVADLAAVDRGLLGEGAGFLFRGDIGLEAFLDVLADAQRIKGLQVRVAFEKDDPVDQLVGVDHLLHRLLAGLGGELGVAPVILQPVAQPELVDRRQLVPERAV